MQVSIVRNASAVFEKAIEGSQARPTHLNPGIEMGRYAGG